MKYKILIGLLIMVLISAGCKQRISTKELMEKDCVWLENEKWKNPQKTTYLNAIDVAMDKKGCKNITDSGVTIINRTLEVTINETSRCANVTVTLPLGVTVITQEQLRKLNNTAKLYQDLMQYTLNNDKELTAQLKEVRNGTKDRIVDPILQEKVDRLHDNIVNEYTGEEVMAFGLGGILEEVFNIADVLNPNNVTIINIRGEYGDSP